MIEGGSLGVGVWWIKWWWGEGLADRVVEGGRVWRIKWWRVGGFGG